MDTSVVSRERYSKGSQIKINILYGQTAPVIAFIVGKYAGQNFPAQLNIAIVPGAKIRQYLPRKVCMQAINYTLGQEKQLIYKELVSAVPWQTFQLLR
jgi:hypothetical protein